ncbi:MAG: hypothetical protein V4532_16730, partial [Pseudomonadota bacterium]
MNWHPFAEKLPLMEGDEWEAFKKSIQSTKGNETPVTYRMVKGKKQGLDGRNRQRACSELKIACNMKMIRCPDDEVRDYILRQNVHRRHLTKEMRQAIVVELRADGQSTRQIANVIGVSQSTVQSDLASGEQKNSPATIQGTDGKTYSATTSLFCDRCKRVGPVKDCQACKDLRGKNVNRTMRRTPREAGS